MKQMEQDGRYGPKLTLQGDSSAEGRKKTEANTGGLQMFCGASMLPHKAKARVNNTPCAQRQPWDL